MSKPSWLTAPEWANFLAQDRHGSWYWYEFEPRINDEGFSWIKGGHFDEAYIDGDEWGKTLELRPL